MPACSSLPLPWVAFFLLHGGGLKGFGVSWMEGLLSGFNDSIGDGGGKLVTFSQTVPIIGSLLWLLGKFLVLLSMAVFYVLLPLTWLNDKILASASPLWADFAATAAIVSLLLFFLAGGVRTGWRALAVSLLTFAGIFVVMAVMGLDRGGLRLSAPGCGAACW